MTRKLDALFAERVLGVFPIQSKDCPTVWTIWEEKERVHYIEPLPRYTQSLDAAWEGVERSGRNGFALEDRIDGWNAGWDADRDGWMTDRGIAPTTALAVVKACLLAVGVSEEEIEEAERDNPKETTP